MPETCGEEAGGKRESRTTVLHHRAWTASSRATDLWFWMYKGAETDRQALLVSLGLGRQTAKQTTADRQNRASLSYLCTILCVACFSKSPSFPAIAQSQLSTKPACREQSKGWDGWCRFSGGGRGYSAATWGETRQSTTTTPERGVE